jgi:ABC-type uncharacterized transport system ATPase component
MELTVRGVYKEFKGVGNEPGFTIEIPPLCFELGRVIYLMGHNGSGKSIFLKLMAGEIMPSAGSVELGIGSHLWHAHRSPCAIVRQKAEDSLALDLTVKENLLLRLGRGNVLERLFPGKSSHSIVANALRMHKSLLSKLEQPCHNLSGGQRQTLAFLAVAIQNRKILFLDEYYSASDIQTSHLLRHLASEYALNSLACVLIVSHNIDIALRDASRILILNSGKLVADLNKEIDRSQWNAETVALLIADQKR